MSRPGKGVPPAASLQNIVQDLFQNEKYRNIGYKWKVTFSKVALTEEQLAQLVIPPEFKSLKFSIVYQTDKFNELGYVSSSIQLVLFVEKAGYIHGLYFDLFGQPVFDPDYLKCSKKPVELSPNVRIVTSQYIELYNNVLGTTTILGLSTNGTPLASLQYSHDCKYYYGNLSSNGIIDPDLSTTFLTGLSKNLHFH